MPSAAYGSGSARIGSGRCGSCPKAKVFGGCGVPVGQYRTIDTAYAGDFIPCPSGHAPAPWPVVAVIVGAASVILNSAIVWNTQCRELTSGEAMTSAFLPFIGIALDAQASKCPNRGT